MEKHIPLFALVDEEIILEKIEELIPEVLEWFQHCPNKETDGLFNFTKLSTKVF